MVIKMEKSVYRNDEFFKHKIIFIHVPKVAGRAMLKSLNIEEVGHNHLFIYELEDRRKFQEFFKIGFVRNPWDRLVSAFFYLKSGGMKNKYDLYIQDKLSSFNSFTEFVYCLGSNKQFRKEMIKEIHFKPQYLWMMNSNGEIEMDYIGYFENLEEGFKILKEKLKKPNAELIKFNQSEHKPFWEYYDKKMVDIVREIYATDIELFKYEFPANNKFIKDISKQNKDVEVNYKKLNVAENFINEFLMQSIQERPIYIWGTGIGGKVTFNLLRNKSVKILGFIDNDSNKWGSLFCGYKVFPPGILKNYYNTKPYVIIGSMYYEEISIQLKNLGLNEKEDYCVNFLFIGNVL